MTLFLPCFDLSGCEVITYRHITVINESLSSNGSSSDRSPSPEKT